MFLPDFECAQAKLPPAQQRGSGDQSRDDPDGEDGDQRGERGAQGELAVLGDHHEPGVTQSDTVISISTKTEIGNLLAYWLMIKRYVSTFISHL